MIRDNTTQQSRCNSDDGDVDDDDGITVDGDKSCNIFWYCGLRGGKNGGEK